jgi:hypothetical protein
MFEESLPFAEGLAEQSRAPHYPRHVAMSAVAFAIIGSLSLIAALRRKPLVRMVPAVMTVSTESVEEGRSDDASDETGRPAKKKQKVPKQKVKAPAAAASIAPAESVFFEGAPSITETFIPGLSILTVVGVIPFSASLARQAWTRYKITNRRIEVTSGFAGKDVVQVSWREINDVRWLRRWGGAAGDLVFTLNDGSKLEVRSMPEFDRNLAFIMNTLGDDVKNMCGYPDNGGQEYLDKVAAGEEPPPTIESVPEEGA